MFIVLSGDEFRLVMHEENRNVKCEGFTQNKGCFKKCCIKPSQCCNAFYFYGFGNLLEIKTSCLLNFI